MTNQRRRKHNDRHGNPNPELSLTLMTPSVLTGLASNPVLPVEASNSQILLDPRLENSTVHMDQALVSLLNGAPRPLDPMKSEDLVGILHCTK